MKQYNERFLNAEINDSTYYIKRQFLLQNVRYIM